MEICIGVICGWFALYFIFPVRANTQIEQISQTNMLLMRDLLSEIQAILFKEKIADNGIAIIKKINENITKLNTFQNALAKEYINSSLHVLYFKTRVDMQITQISYLKDLYLLITENKVGRSILQEKLNIEVIFDELKTLMQELAEGKDTEKYLNIKNSIEDTKKTWESLKSEKIFQYETWENLNFFSLLEDLERFLESTENYLLLKEQDVTLKPIEKDTKQKVKNLFIYDPLFLKASIKVGLSAALAIYLWSQTAWPLGILGVISTFIIAIQKNIYDVQLQGELRFLGALVGGGIGLLCLHFFVYDVVVLALTLFVFTWFFGYLSSVPSRYNYAAMQANMAFAIIIVHSNSPLMTVAPAMQRIGGVLFGILVAFTVAKVLWPVHPISLLRTIANKVLKKEQALFENITLAQDDFGSNDILNLINEYQNLLVTVNVYKNSEDPDLQQAIIFRRLICRLSTIIFTLTKKIDFKQAQIIAEKYQIDIMEIHGKINKLMSAVNYDSLDGQLNQVLLSCQKEIENTVHTLREQHKNLLDKPMKIEDKKSLFQLLEVYQRIINTLLHTVELKAEVKNCEVL